MVFGLRLAISLSAASAIFLASAVRADVVVLANRSRRAVRFELIEGQERDRPFTLAQQRVMTLIVAEGASLRLPDNEGRVLKLAPDSAYFFHDAKNQKIALTQIGLGSSDTPPDENRGPAHLPDATKRRAADEPVPPPPGRLADDEKPLLTVPVKVLVDDEERGVRRLWEERLRRRMASASRVFERQFRVRFEVVATDTWKSDDSITDFDESRREFEQLVNVRPARLAIGFTSQYQAPNGYPHLGPVQAPLVAHRLLPEASPLVSEAERCELLVHELGHYLGAAHSPEASSAMRPALGDRRANMRGFSLGIDPVNSLAIALVAEQVSVHDIESLAQLAAPKRQRLHEIYTTLLQVLSDDPAAIEYLTLVERPPALAADSPPAPDQSNDKTAEAKAPPVTVEVRLDSFIRATQEVLRAIALAANRNHRLAEGAAEQRSAAPLPGDDLTGLYVRAAAQAALKLPAEQRGPAFFLGLALGLDRTERIRKYAVLGDLIQKIDPDADRRRRLAVLGHPTLAGREDLVQHFFFSAAIAAMAGESSAESVGLAKELTDSRGGSGFSFVDWCADLSGIALTMRVRSGDVPLTLLATHFRGADHLPDIDGLEEGLTRDDFTRRFGSTSDKRFRRIDNDIRQRIKQLYQRHQ